MKIQANSRLVFMGDSVTDCGRSRPIAQGLFDPLGKGYPCLVNALFNACCPELRIHVINMGDGGDTSRGNLNRWDDIMALKPDWVSLMIGINDVWRQFDVPTMPDSHVLPEEYEQNLIQIIEKTLPHVKGMVLMTPYYIESNPQDAMRARMDEYGAICKKLAEKYQLVFVDTQAAFNEALKYQHSAYFAWDRVHPNIPGHAVLAKAFLKAVDFEWK